MAHYPPSNDFTPQAAPPSPIPALRTATLVLFWLTAAASAAVTVSTFLRRGAWKDSLAAGTGITDDLTSHDVPVIISVFVLTMVVVTSAVAVAAWSMRLVLSAQARGVTGVSPGWAAGGWFVPLGFLVLGFRQITKAVNALGGNGIKIIGWQIAFASAAIVMSVAQFSSQDVSAIPTDNSISVFTRECLLSLASTFLFIASAALATRAIIDADRTIDAAPLTH
ncbi:MAG: hypothetical protein ABIR32_22040 [Ilumatobacteraceae bacterium]